MIYRNRVNTTASVNTLPYIWPTDVPINSGDITVFAQTNAPTGYTKLTTHNDKALRIVSGAVGSGGTTAFSTVFTNQTPTLSGLVLDPTTITIPTMPGHTHFVGGGSISNYPVSSFQPPFITASAGSSSSTSLAGGGLSHTHPLSLTAPTTTLGVLYVDIILAQKN